MKRVWLLLICLCAALLLTACHVDHDPWPVDGALPVAAFLTTAPTQAPTATPVPTSTPTPSSTATPLPPSPTTIPDITMPPTPIPGGDDSPGLNGQGLSPWTPDCAPLARRGWRSSL